MKTGNNDTVIDLQTSVKFLGQTALPGAVFCSRKQ